jgi:hypothetical protein
MQKPTESKVECRVSFSKDRTPTQLTQEFHGVLHLIEHQVDRVPPFWYGVLEVACDTDDVQSAVDDQDSTRVFLTLVGRGRAMARLTSGRVEGQPNIWCLGIVGVTGLQ